VRTFQRSRDLPVNGVVDQTTWERLVEARWQLGQRLLYLMAPNQRGDDVAELQTLLAQLGFNPDRIDGIFGPETAGALAEFQRNCALEPSATLTKGTLQMLQRLRATEDARQLVIDARDRASFNALISGSVLLCGQGDVAESLGLSLHGRESVHQLLGRSVEESARTANTLGVALVLSFNAAEEVSGIHLHYWAGYRSHSRRGEFVAATLATVLAGQLEAPVVAVSGTALPILRETRMTSVHLEHGNLSEQELHLAITALESLVEQVIHNVG